MNPKLNMTFFHDSLERYSFDDNRCLGVPDLESDGVHRLQPVRHVVEDEVAVLQQLVMLITRRL